MIRTFLAAVAALGLIAGTASASSCPMHMSKIDAALPGAKITDAQKAEVAKLRAEGEALHKSGKHAESMSALAKAESILGIK